MAYANLPMLRASAPAVTRRELQAARSALQPGLGRGDPARRRINYYPVWLDNMADDVTTEGAAINGAVQGAEAVRLRPLAA